MNLLQKVSELFSIHSKMQNFYFKKLRFAGHDAASKDTYSKLSEKIERMSKIIDLCFFKLQIAPMSINILIRTAINYYYSPHLWIKDRIDRVNLESKPVKIIFLFIAHFQCAKIWPRWMTSYFFQMFWAFFMPFSSVANGILHILRKILFLSSANVRRRPN